MSILKPLVLAALQLGLAVFPSGHSDEEWSVEERQVKTYSFALAPGAAAIEVDDHTGSIRVRPGAGDRVEATVTEIVRAVSREGVAEARREVRLDAGPRGGGVRFYVDGPFRCERCRGCGLRQDNERGGDCLRQDSWDDPPYEVQYDFELRVPARSNLTLATVNRGDIEVEGVEGVFLVRNVNGAVRLQQVAGSGKARTVNGEVRISLVRAPADAWRLATINGDVEISLPPSAGADLHVETMNGEAWSDFPFTTLPPAPATRSRRDGLKVYSSEGSRLRLGAGGPLVAMETLNGDVLVRKSTR